MLSLCLNVFSEYNIDLEDVIRDETSGDFTTALLAMLQANKDENGEVDTDLARKDAEVQEKCASLPLLMCMNHITVQNVLFHEYKEKNVEDTN